MHKMAVLAKSVAGRVEELARWYDEQHFPDLLAVPGIVSAERLVVTPLKMPADTTAWDFLLIYEFEGDDPWAVVRAMGERQATMVWSDALDRESAVSMIGKSCGVRKAGAGSATTDQPHL